MSVHDRGMMVCRSIQLPCHVASPFDSPRKEIASRLLISQFVDFSISLVMTWTPYM
jgi:hypothetical protein